DKLHDKILEHIEFSKKNNLFEEHRKKQLKKKVINIIKNHFENEFLKKVSDFTDFDAILNDIADGKTNPYKIGKELFEKFLHQ
ncbi:MAG: hypothetical protein DWP97_12395, partial [Calditrichaeota bacterium]